MNRIQAMKSKLLLCLALVLSGTTLIEKCHAAITFPKQAEKYRTIAYQKTVSFYHDANPGLAPAPKNLQIDKLNVTNGFREYWVDDQSVLSGTFLPRTNSTSLEWSYMIMCGTNMVGIMVLAWETNHWSFGGTISSGAALKGQQDPIWVGLEKAERLPQVKSRNYEFRTLGFSPDDSPMIWLHGDSEDILIPLSNGYGKWKAYKPYSEKQIVKLLKPEAEEELKQGKMYNAISSALEDYEKAHGNKCGTLTIMPGVDYLKAAGTHVWICKLYAMSSKCGSVNYKARIAFTDQTRSAVKRVEILEKLPETNNSTKP
jgi:hypothetical protein